MAKSFRWKETFICIIIHTNIIRHTEKEAKMRKTTAITQEIWISMINSGREMAQKAGSEAEGGGEMRGEKIKGERAEGA